MVTSKQREQYRLIRYDYYHAGRILHLMGNFHSASIMLGYAVETTMKAGLMEVLTDDQQKTNTILGHAHDIRRIISECRKHGIFNDVQVSEDFLKHIDYHFRRYPSQISKALDNANEQHEVIGNSIDWVFYYDDLIVQLDDCLLKRTSDPMISIIYHAIRTLETKYARDILRKNAFAILKFDEYAVLIRQNMPERKDLRTLIEENLSKGAIYYWNPEAQEVMTENKINAIVNKYSASTFKLPKWTSSGGIWKAVIP